MMSVGTLDPSRITVRKDMCVVKLKPLEDKVNGLYMPAKKKRKVIEGTLVALGAAPVVELGQENVGQDVVLHGYAECQYKFLWGQAEYGLYLTEDIMGVMQHG